MSPCSADATGTGHFQPFYQLDQILNRLTDVDLVHLQAGWFMESLVFWADAVAKHGRIAWSLKPDVRTPWVTTDDIATFAARELMNPTGRHRAVRQLGADHAMSEIAAIIGREIDRLLEYRFIDRARSDVQAGFLRRFGTMERWLDDSQTMDALNDGRGRFHDGRPSLPTTMQAFVREVWRPKYTEAVATARQDAETYLTWIAGDEPGAHRTA